MATLLKVLNNLADIKSAGGVALRVRTQGCSARGAPLAAELLSLLVAPLAWPVSLLVQLPSQSSLSFALLLIRPWMTDDIFRFGADQAAARGAATATSIASSQRAASRCASWRNV